MNVKLRNFINVKRLFPNDWRIMNNIGYILYNMGDVEGSSQALKKHLTTDNSIVSNNVGAVKHMKAESLQMK